MRELAVFALAGVGSYLVRSVFILALGDRRLPDVLEAALRNVGPAVLAALTTSLLLDDGLRAYLTDLPEVGASVVAVVVALLSRNFLAVFVSGMAALWLLQLLSSGVPAS